MLITWLDIAITYIIICCPPCGLKKLTKLDIRFKKGNRDHQIRCSFVKNDTNKSVKIERFAGTNGDFLSHAHYRDPYFDF